MKTVKRAAVRTTHQTEKMKVMPTTTVFKFIQAMRGYDIMRGDKNIPYWSAYLSGFTPPEIINGQTPYHVVVAKELPIRKER